VRLRLLIPAALAAAATYLALVRDEPPRVATKRVASPPPPPSPTPAPPRLVAVMEPPAPSEAPPPPEPPRDAAPSIFEDLAPSTSPPGPSLIEVLAGEPPDETSAVPARQAPADDTVEDAAPRDPAWDSPLEVGRFALGGWAASGGHSVVSAVTFRRRLPADVTPDRIVLEIDARDNVPEGGLVVLSDPGFAPDRDGFTLLLAAATPGPFSAAGSYRVLPAG
jgi:hypothetical protein